eukprot:s1356_g18.t1
MGMWGGMQAMAAMNNMAMNNMAMNNMAMMGCGWNPAMAAVQASVPLTSLPTAPSQEGARSKASGGPPPAAPPPAAMGFQQASAPAQPSQVKNPPRASGVTVIMTIAANNEQGYIVEKDEEAINEMLDTDWSHFLRLVGPDRNAAGRGSVAIGVQEVAEKIGEAQALFVVPQVGQTGEELAVSAAMGGGRSYILSTIHELYQEVSKWRCAAILKNAAPLSSLSRKRARKDEPQVPSCLKTLDMQMLPKAIIYLGSEEGLKDENAIPQFTKQVGRFLLTLGAEVVFKTLTDAFNKLEGRVAYRKSLVYMAHELFTKRKRHITFEDQRQCVEQFLLPIGPSIRAMRAREREAYCDLVAFWGKHQVVSQTDLKRIKDAWDVDEEGDFDEFEDDL